MPVTFLIPQYDLQLDCSLNYKEKDTIISGSHTIPGASVNIYLDGDLIGTAVVSGSGTWSDTVDTNTLYTDGARYATAIDGLNAESDSSNVCTIDCILPQSNLSITATDTVICQVIDSASIDVINSQSGIIYEAYDAIGDSAIGTSVLGTGSTITLFTFPLVVSPSKISARAFKISPVLCEVVLTDTATFIIDPLPDTALVVTPAAARLFVQDNHMILVS